MEGRANSRSLTCGRRDLRLNQGKCQRCGLVDLESLRFADYMTLIMSISDREREQRFRLPNGTGMGCLGSRSDSVQTQDAVGSFLTATTLFDPSSRDDPGYPVCSRPCTDSNGNLSVSSPMGRVSSMGRWVKLRFAPGPPLCKGSNHQPLAEMATLPGKRIWGSLQSPDWPDSGSRHKVVATPFSLEQT